METNLTAAVSHNCSPVSAFIFSPLFPGPGPPLPRPRNNASNFRQLATDLALLQEQ